MSISTYICVYAHTYIHTHTHSTLPGYKSSMKEKLFCVIESFILGTQISDRNLVSA